MSRSAAATTAGRARTIPRSPVPSLPRRVSGPTAPNRRDDGPAAPRRRDDGSAAPRRRDPERPRTRSTATPRARTFAPPRPQRLAYGGVAIASRMAGVALDVSASRAMDRLVRSRLWIGIIAFGLIGLVAMQVSLLKLNSGIGRAVQTSSTLERSNAGLRAEISRLSDGDRVQRLGEGEGLVMPAPSDITYLRAGDTHSDAVRAVQHMQAPNPLTAGVAGVASTTSAPAVATATPTADTTSGTTAVQATATPAAASTAGTAGTAAPATAAAGTGTGTAAPQTTNAVAPAQSSPDPPAAQAAGAGSGGAVPATTP
jgi:hypothetical protein